MWLIDMVTHSYVTYIYASCVTHWYGDSFMCDVCTSWLVLPWNYIWTRHELIYIFYFLTMSHQFHGRTRHIWCVSHSYGDSFVCYFCFFDEYASFFREVGDSLSYVTRSHVRSATHWYVTLRVWLIPCYVTNSTYHWLTNSTYQWLFVCDWFMGEDCESFIHIRSVCSHLIGDSFVRGKCSGAYTHVCGVGDALKCRVREAFICGNSYDSLIRRVRDTLICRVRDIFICWVHAGSALWRTLSYAEFVTYWYVEFVTYSYVGFMWERAAKDISLKLETQDCTTNLEIPPRKAEFPIFFKLRITCLFSEKET